MKVSYVYILRCSDGTYYTGVTTDLNQRLLEHQAGKHPVSHTYTRRPICLVFFAEFTCAHLAIEKEKQIKKWSRAKKEALIKGRYDTLPNLAKKNLCNRFLIHHFAMRKMPLELT
ncbi:GIY-YIG nuclease family protein [Spongiimicrobium sp. 2-473A-2-J]|uniref:GIY-YIG nuclease family protein n=1 Tax=Eudoraea algarum TaxID=3417568 RepID=UPI003D35A9CA